MGKILFKYLAKQTDVKVFSIFIQNINKKLKILQEIIAEVTAVSTDNINFQINKTDKLSTDPKTVVPEEYHNFLNEFSKEASDTITAHSKYNQRIRLLKSHKNFSYNLLHELL